MSDLTWEQKDRYAGESIGIFDAQGHALSLCIRFSEFPETHAVAFSETGEKK